MTETEAKTKWCPMVRVRITALFTDGQDDQRMKAEVADKEDKCVGSRCMMWRWRMEYLPIDWVGKDFKKEQKKIQEGGGYIDSVNEGDPSGLVAMPSSRGYCGLTR